MISLAIELLVGIEAHSEKEWAKKLSTELSDNNLQLISDKPQHCNVSFALKQAERRLSTANLQQRETFGIESLITTLQKLPKNEKSLYYILENQAYLGTCYSHNDKL